MLQLIRGKVRSRKRERKRGWGVRVVGWGGRRGQGWWQCVSPEPDGLLLGCVLDTCCSPPELPLSSDRGSPVWQSAVSSVATVTEACVDQYKCVHEIKALPYHPYSPATHALSLRYNPTTQTLFVKICRAKPTFPKSKIDVTPIPEMLMKDVTCPCRNFKYINIHRAHTHNTNI